MISSAAAAPGLGQRSGAARAGGVLAISFLAETVKMARRLDVNLSIQRDGAAKASAIERDVGKNLRFIRRLDDVKGPGRAASPVSALVAGSSSMGTYSLPSAKSGHELRSSTPSFMLQAILPVFASTANEVALFSDEINIIVRQNRRAGRRREIECPKLDRTALDNFRTAGRIRARICVGIFKATIWPGS